MKRSETKRGKKKREIKRVSLRKKIVSGRKKDHKARIPAHKGEEKEKELNRKIAAGSWKEGAKPHLSSLKR